MEREAHASTEERRRALSRSSSAQLFSNNIHYMEFEIGHLPSLTIKDIAMSQSSLVFTVAATPALGAAVGWKEKKALPLNNAAACHIKLFVA
jgi:hypothetical protein